MHKWIRWSFFGLLYLSLLGTLVCDQYVLITHERLDEAFFLFDWNEIWMIADPVHRLTWPIGLGLLFLLALPFLLYRQLFPSIHSTRWILGIILTLNIVRLIPNPSESSRLAENRFIYFVKTSIKSLIQPRQINKVTQRAFKDLEPSLYGDPHSTDPRFPLAHTLETTSVLEQYLKKTTNYKPPHIKIIIGTR